MMSPVHAVPKNDSDSIRQRRTDSVLIYVKSSRGSPITLAAIREARGSLPASIPTGEQLGSAKWPIF
jgi:hypothetical protein